MSSIKSRVFGIALGAVAVVVGLGADTPTQTIDANGLAFQAPAAWKSSKPSNPMRRAELRIAPVKGDKDQAELVVFAFPGGGGGTEANIKRWQGFFKDADGNPPKVETKVVKGKNVDVTRAETAGRYVAPVSPGSRELNNKPDYHLLGAIVQADDTGFFLRLIGPEKTVVAARPAFDELIASIQAAGK
jgi:hypothetical protein